MEDQLLEPAAIRRNVRKKQISILNEYEFSGRLAVEWRTYPVWNAVQNEMSILNDGRRMPNRISLSNADVIVMEPKQRRMARKSSSLLGLTEIVVQPQFNPSLKLSIPNAVIILNEIKRSLKYLSKKLKSTKSAPTFLVKASKFNFLQPAYVKRKSRHSDDPMSYQNLSLVEWNVQSHQSSKCAKRQSDPADPQCLHRLGLLQ